MNTLQFETSPYLLQHQDNPVAWMAWGEAAFNRAKAENKLVFLSIGYSTCHWCHVMAHGRIGLMTLLARISEHWQTDPDFLNSFDAIFGGFGGAPKFPCPHQLILKRCFTIRR